MENDILIAGLMALGSVVALVGVIVLIARATRETPAQRRNAGAPEPTPRAQARPGLVVHP